MKLVQVRSFEGRNVHCARPVVEACLDLEAHAEVTTDRLEGFVPRLTELLPGIARHHCGLGYAGGFGVRLTEGTLLGHVSEHVALELLWRAGDQVRYGKTRLLTPPALYRVVVEQETPGLGAEALAMAVQVVADLAEGRIPPVRRMLAQLRRLRAQLSLGPSTLAIWAAAQARGIPVRRLGSGNLMQLGQGVHSRRVWATLTDADGAVAVDIAQDKELTRQLLGRAGLPVPEGGLAESPEAAESWLARLGAPVVVKPVGAAQGRGVRMNLWTPGAVREAFAQAAEAGGGVLVERQMAGLNLRVLVVGKEVAAAALRHPPEVIGDGHHRLSQLVQRLNREPGRGEGHGAPLTRVRLTDPAVLACLAAQGMDPASVPEPGRRVRLRDAANLSTGATAEDVTDRLNPILAGWAVEAARIVGLEVAGVDLIAGDVERPPLPGEACILEVNAAPGLRMHLAPSKGASRPVARRLVDLLIPPPATGRIPVVAITGTNGKTTTARLVAHLMRRAGCTVGLATTDGVFVDGRLIMAGDTTGPLAAERVLSHRQVEVAVLECARGGLRRRGLAFDRCQVSAVLNVGPDHLGQDGIDTLDDLAHVKAMVVEATAPQGAAVLNADDPRVRAMARLTEAEKIWFWPRADGHGWPMARRAVMERAGHLVWRDGQREHLLVGLGRLSFAFGGASRPMVENAMAAAAIGLALGLSPEAVGEGLASFGGGPELNPGRMNLWRVGGVTVLLDYGHNPPAVAGLVATARRLATGRLLGVVCAPGDRRDGDLMTLGEVAGRGMDRLWIKEDRDLRGRRPGEVAALLEAGALRGGRGRAEVRVILDEGQALAAALQEARAEDLVVLLYEEYAATVRLLEALGGTPDALSVLPPARALP